MSEQPQSGDVVDTFVLFNERESEVQKIVGELESYGFTTHFWRRDVQTRSEWEKIESVRLRDSRVVMVFLGREGWGSTHVRLTEEALKLKKPIVPVLLADVNEKELAEANRLFLTHSYFDLRKDSVRKLADETRRLLPGADENQQLRRSNTQQFDRIIGVLVDGNESQRAELLWQIRNSKTLDRPALASRLVTEIRERFGPSSESNIATAIRDPKLVPSARSWMFSTLILTSIEDSDAQRLVREHLKPEIEPDRSVRFWILAGLTQIKAPFLIEVAANCLSDPAEEVSVLALALDSREGSEEIENLRSRLISNDIQKAWPVLRAIRVHPVPSLAKDLCHVFVKAEQGSSLSYDTLYALANPEMARAAAPTLTENPGVEKIVERIILDAREQNPNAIRNFSVLLAALDRDAVDRALAVERVDSVGASVANLISRYLKELRRNEGMTEYFVAGFASDTINPDRDELGIQEDVQVLTAVMLAKEVRPPLAVGLFGDWGSGKSFFMKSIKAAAKEMSDNAKKTGSAIFHHNIVSIEFNAWNYADTNLWASLVSHILEDLAQHVTPRPTAAEQKSALMSELNSAKTELGEAEAEKTRMQDEVKERQEELQKLQVDRQQAEIKLSDLRASDLKSLLASDETLKKQLTEALDQLGVPAALNSAADLSAVVSEAYTVRGRISGLFTTLQNRWYAWVLIGLLVATPVLMPLIAWILKTYVFTSEFVAEVSAAVTQVSLIVASVSAVLRTGLTAVKENLKKVEQAKQKVDELIAARRQTPTMAETTLQEKIATLKADEQIAVTRLQAAATRVQDLEERINAVKEGRSLARFLAERTRSEDYRKHLGLISTIRQDLQSLSDRLSPGAGEADIALKPVDRIILFIDDLDRCTADKVLEVLQAVHLLLAYELFVVVVGVDPRWLLHSLATTYPAFGAGDTNNLKAADSWRTTPQNYLEKIFQIPFSVRPMTVEGFGRLMSGLLTSSHVKQEISEPDPLPMNVQKRDKTPTEESIPSQSTSSTSPSPVVPPSAQRSKTQTISTTPAELLINEDSLIIKPWETSFAESLFSFIPTPRAAKRFSNIYRLLKAPLRREDLPKFEGVSEMPGDFRVPMLLLAVLLGAPAEAVELFPLLLRHARRDGPVLNALQDLATLNLTSLPFQDLQSKLISIVSRDDFPRSRDIYLYWIPRVSRFSFDLGRVIHNEQQQTSAHTR